LEVRKIIETNYKKAQKILKENADKLHTMAETLLTYETIDVDQIDDIMAGAKPRAPKDWDEPKALQAKRSKKTSIKGPAEEL
jgi:cell division protease FtsH